MRWLDVDISEKIGWERLAQTRNFAVLAVPQHVFRELPNGFDTKICYHAGLLKESLHAVPQYTGPLRLEPLHENLVGKVIKAASDPEGANLPLRLDKALYILFGINCMRAEAAKPLVGPGAIVVSAFYIRGLVEARLALEEDMRNSSRAGEARAKFAMLQDTIRNELCIDERLCKEILKGHATSIDLAIRVHDCLVKHKLAENRVPRELDRALSSCMDKSRKMAEYERFNAQVLPSRIPSPYKRP